MSRTRTVHCGYCYEQGHNKRSCEKYTAAILRLYKDHIKQRLEASPQTQSRYDFAIDSRRKEYIKRSRLDPDTGLKIEKHKDPFQFSRTVASMKCSYCSNLGHTRRTCRNLENDRIIFIEATKVFRTNALRTLTATGVGIGSLVIDGDQWGIVTAVRWKEIIVTAPNEPILKIQTSKEMAGHVADWYSRVNSLSIEAAAAVTDTPIPIGGHYGNQSRNHTLALRRSMKITPSGPLGLNPPSGWIENYTLNNKQLKVCMHMSSKSRHPLFFNRTPDDQSWAQIQRAQLKMPIDAYDKNVAYFEDWK
jgi:hypothetical protein